MSKAQIITSQSLSNKCLTMLTSKKYLKKENPRRESGKVNS
jgi:hypothetical protein